MIEAALTLTTALTLMTGAKPEALREGLHQAMLNAVRQHIVTDMPPTVCRMPILPSDDARVDKRFILKPAPDAPQMHMPSVGKLVPCPLAKSIR